MPRKPRIDAVTPRSDESQFNVDDINARRLRGERRRENALPMRDPGKWALRWANSLAEPNRHYTIVQEDGWLPVTVDDLAEGLEVQSIGAQVGHNGQLCKGPNGDERLYKKLKTLHDQIKLTEAHLRQKPMRSERAAKDDVAEAAAGQLGSDAAEFIHKNTSISIRDSQGIITGA